MQRVNYSEVIILGAILVILPFIAGINIALINESQHDVYCRNISILCNVTKINYVTTWTPVNKKLTGCLYKGDLDFTLPNNKWNNTKCFYDNQKTECPLEECPGISTVNLVFVKIGLWMIGVLSILYIIVSIICLCLCFEYCVSNNRSNNHSYIRLDTGYDPRW